MTTPVISNNDSLRYIYLIFSRNSEAPASDFFKSMRRCTPGSDAFNRIKYSATLYCVYFKATTVLINSLC